MGYGRRANSARASQLDILMPRTTGTASSRPQPIDFVYQHNQELANGARFLVLPTLEALESHWERIGHSMPFAAQGNCPGKRPLYLRPHEWIFAPTRPKLVEAVVRWKEMGIEPIWYDWKKENPEEYCYYFRERNATRLSRVSNGSWSQQDERNHLAAVARKNPDNFTGWWRLANLPYDQSHETWFSGLLDEPSDPRADTEAINTIFQHQTFIDWKHQSFDEVILMDATDVELELQDLRNSAKKLRRS